MQKNCRYVTTSDEVFESLTLNASSRTFLENIRICGDNFNINTLKHLGSEELNPICRLFIEHFQCFRHLNFIEQCELLSELLRWIEVLMESIKFGEAIISNLPFSSDETAITEWIRNARHQLREKWFSKSTFSQKAFKLYSVLMNIPWERLFDCGIKEILTLCIPVDFIGNKDESEQIQEFQDNVTRIIITHMSYFSILCYVDFFCRTIKSDDSPDYMLKEFSKAIKRQLIQMQAQITVKSSECLWATILLFPSPYELLLYARSVSELEANFDRILIDSVRSFIVHYEKDDTFNNKDNSRFFAIKMNPAFICKVISITLEFLLNKFSAEAKGKSILDSSSALSTIMPLCLMMMEGTSKNELFKDKSIRESLIVMCLFHVAAEDISRFGVESPVEIVINIISLIIALREASTNHQESVEVNFVEQQYEQVLLLIAHCINVRESEGRANESMRMLSSLKHEELSVLFCTFPLVSPLALCCWEFMTMSGTLYFEQIVDSSYAYFSTKSEDPKEKASGNEKEIVIGAFDDAIEHTHNEKLGIKKAISLGYIREDEIDASEKRKLGGKNRESTNSVILFISNNLHIIINEIFTHQKRHRLQKVDLTLSDSSIIDSENPFLRSANFRNSMHCDKWIQRMEQIWMDRIFPRISMIWLFNESALKSNRDILQPEDVKRILILLLQNFVIQSDFRIINDLEANKNFAEKLDNLLFYWKSDECNSFDESSIKGGETFKFTLRITNSLCFSDEKRNLLLFLICNLLSPSQTTMEQDFPKQFFLHRLCVSFRRSVLTSVINLLSKQYVNLNATKTKILDANQTGNKAIPNDEATQTLNDERIIVNLICYFLSMVSETVNFLENKRIPSNGKENKIKNSDCEFNLNAETMSIAEMQEEMIMALKEVRFLSLILKASALEENKWSDHKLWKESNRLSRNFFTLDLCSSCDGCHFAAEFEFLDDKHERTTSKELLLIFASCSLQTLHLLTSFLTEGILIENEWQDFLYHLLPLMSDQFFLVLNALIFIFNRPSEVIWLAFNGMCSLLSLVLFLFNFIDAMSTIYMLLADTNKTENESGVQISTTDQLFSSSFSLNGLNKWRNHVSTGIGNISRKDLLLNEIEMEMQKMLALLPSFFAMAFIAYPSVITPLQNQQEINEQNKDEKRKVRAFMKANVPELIYCLCSVKSFLADEDQGPSKRTLLRSLKRALEQKIDTSNKKSSQECKNEFHFSDSKFLNSPDNLIFQNSLIDLISAVELSELINFELYEKIEILAKAAKSQFEAHFNLDKFAYKISISGIEKSPFPSLVPDLPPFSEFISQMLYVLTSRFLIESADTLSQAKTSKKQQETNSSVRDISSKDSTEILNKEGNVRITKMQVQEGGTLVTRYFVESFASYLEVIGTRLLSIPIRRYLQMSDSPLTVEEYKISKGASAKLNEEEAFHFGLPLKGSQKIITVSDRIGCLMRELLAYFETKREEIEASNLILKVKVNDMWRSFISGEKIEEEAKKEVHMKGKYIKSLRLLLTSVYTLLFSSFGPLVGSALHLIGSMLGTAGVQVSVCLIKWFGAFRDSLQIELAKKLMSFSKNEEQKNENVCIQREETAKDTLLLYVLQQNGRIWTDTKSHSALQENAGVLMGQLINAFAPTSVLRLAGVSALRHATAGSEIVEKLLQYFLEYCIGNGRLGEVLKVIGSIQPIRISQSTGGGTKGNDNLSVVKVHSPLTPFSRELSEMLCSLPRRSSSRSIGEASLMDAIEVLGWCCENFTFTLAEHLFRPTIFSFAIYVALSVDTPVHSWLLGLECEECENLSSEFKLQELQKEKKKRKTPVKIVLEMIKLLVMVGKEKPEIVSWVREEAISRLPGFALKVLGLFSAEIRMTEHEGIFDKGKEKYLVLSLDLLRIMLDCLKEVGVFLEEVTTGRIILPKSCPPAESFVGLQMPEKGKGEYGTVVMGSSSIIGRALKTFVSEASFHDVGKEIFHSANSLCKTFEALRFRNKK